MSSQPTNVSTNLKELAAVSTAKPRGFEERCGAQVLAVSPDSVLPWVEGFPSLVAAPRHVRPRSDLNLASATSRILDGVCRHAFRLPLPLSSRRSRRQVYLSELGCGPWGSTAGRYIEMHCGANG